MHHDVDIRVRYAETDQMGVVYHSNYFPWFEEARTAFFEAAGVSYAALEEQGLLFPLTECGCRYLSPAKYADWVTVRARIRAVKGIRVTLGYEVFRREGGALLAEGHTTHVFVGRDFRPVNLRRDRPELHDLLRKLAEEGEA